jgi:zinc transporter ZupT
VRQRHVEQVGDRVAASVSFGFAAGAMLALVVMELLPEALRSGVVGAVLGTLVGTGGMLALSAALGI